MPVTDRKQGLNSPDSRQMALNIRRHAINMTHLGKSSHVGSVLSLADILAVLYAKVLNIDPEQPKMASRDRFILSKGHAGAGVYAFANRLLIPFGLHQVLNTFF